MPSNPSSLPPAPSALLDRLTALGRPQLLGVLLDHQRRAWERGNPEVAEDYLARLPDLRGDEELLVELLHAESLLRAERGEPPDRAAPERRFPHLAERLHRRRVLQQSLPGLLVQLLPRSEGPETVTLRLAPQRPAPKADGAENGNGGTRIQSPAQMAQAAARSLSLVHELPQLPGYETLERIGQGAMGVVYRARHLRLNRVVALKMILAGAHADPADLQRFLHEAEAVARLQHPNVVQLFEVGQHQGLPYFTLEFVGGGTLAQHLAGTPLPPTEAARVVEQLARGIQHAHEHQIVHRDLKPANILLVSGEWPDSTTHHSPLTTHQPKITDFGLAKRVEVDSELTASGAIVGTPSYMAPEQARGEGKHVGPAADVYALGAILYECLTGRPPFRAAMPADTLLQVLRDEPITPRRLQPTVPRDLETICLKCLQKAPHRRYARALDLAEDLRAWQEGRPITARPVGLVERTWKWARRRPASATLLGFSLLVILAGALGGVVYNRHLQQARDATQAAALVQMLRSAETASVPRIVSELAAYRVDAGPELQRLLDEAEPGSRQALHARLALLPSDGRQVTPLFELLLCASPDELIVLREALQPHAHELAGRLWSTLLDGRADRGGRLRAACALAMYQPDDSRWRDASARVTAQLVAEDALHVGRWAELLRPMRHALTPPILALLHDRDRPEADRRLVTSLLADYAADRPETLADAIQQADAWQFGTLFPNLSAQRERAVARLRWALAQPRENNGDDSSRETDAGRRANAAVALVRLGEPASLGPLLRHNSDPSSRSFLVNRLALLGANPQELVRRLEGEQDVSARRALILALGDFSGETLPAALRQSLVAKLLNDYRSDPDAGIHAAIDWLLRHGREGGVKRPAEWGQSAALAAIDADLAGKPAEGRHWYVNRQGHTFAIIPGPVEFLMGSPGQEADHPGDETLHRRRLDRSFALATKEVTVRQFQAFLRANPGVRHELAAKFSPEPDCPVNGVTWYEAAQYCRWLSEQGPSIPPDQYCYPALAEIEKSKDAVRPLKVPKGYLARTGYRLPTEAEWEYACRAGAVTSRYYGGSLALLPRYAWYIHNSGDRTWPVGQKRPNDLGLFDMHGNVWEWCHESAWNYPVRLGLQPIEDREDSRDVVDRLNRSLRGGAFNYHQADVRCASRLASRPANRYSSVGFRICRTVD